MIGSNTVKVILQAYDQTKGAFDAAKAGVRGVTGAFDDAKSAARGVGDAFESVKRAAAAIGIGLAAKEFIETSDKVALLDARLKLVTATQQEFAGVQKDLIALASDNRLGLEETTQLYIKLAEPVKRLGGGVRETEAVVDSFSKALKLGGASAEDAASATLQFAQAMASGKLQGDEFKSLAETSPRLMKAMAEGMGEPIEKLKEMGSEGKLTADVVANALIKQKATLTSEFATLPVTVGDALTQIKNDWLVGIRELQAETGINEALAGGLQSLRAGLPGIKAEIIAAASSIGEWFERNRAAIGEVVDGVVKLGGELWDVAKSVGSVVAWVAEWAVQSGVVKASVTGLRYLMAGLEDGVKFIAAGFAQVGSVILDYVIYPMSGFSESIKQAAADSRAFADKVIDDFANGRTAVAKLTDEVLRNKEANENSTKSAAMAGLVVGENGALMLDAAGAARQAAKATTAAGDAYVHLKNKTAAAGKETGKGAKELAKAETEYKKLITSIREKTATQQAELTSEAKLTDMQKFALKVMTDLRDGRLKLTEEQRIGLATELEAMLQAERAADARAAETAALKSYEVTWSEYLGGIEKEIAKRDEEIATLGLSATAIARRNLLLAEERLELAKTGGVADDYLQKLQQEVELRKGLLDKTEILEARQALADNAKETAETWKKTSEEISGSITDALMRGFENGKGFLENLVDTAKSLFKTMVLRPVIKAVVDPVAEGVNGLVSQAGSSAFSAIMGSSLASAGGVAGLGHAFYAGMGLTTTEAGAAASAYSSAGMGATGTALEAGSYASVGGPYALAIIGQYIMAQMNKAGWGRDNDRGGFAEFAANPYLYMAHTIGSRLVGHNRNTNFDATGIAGTITADGFSGQSWQDMSRKGGALREAKRWTDYAPLDAGAADVISSQSRLATTATLSLAKLMGEDVAEGLKSWRHEFSVQLSENGDLSKAGEKLAGEILKASDSLAQHLFPSLEQLKLEGESTSQVLARLGSIFDVTNASALMLGRNWQDAFGAIGIASAAARQQLVDMSGGVDAMRNKLGTYYESYFTQTEKNQRSLELLDAQFAAMGVRLDLSKEAFRSYLEDSSKVDLATEAGRKLYAGMLDLATPFSQLVDALGDGAAGKQVGSLASLLGEKSPIAENVKQAAADWWSKYGTAVEKQADQAAQIKAGLDNMSAAFKSMEIALMQAMQSAQQAALLSNTQSAQAVANAVQLGIKQMTDVVEGAITSAQSAGADQVANAVEGALVSTQRW